MTKSVILIGGGVAGLCTGSYASANGYTPIIFEANSTPGGLCTAWPKDGYTIDFCPRSPDRVAKNAFAAPGEQEQYDYGRDFWIPA